MTVRAREVVYELPEYIPGKPIEEVQKEYGLDHVIKLASNENPLGPSPKAVAAVREAAGRMHLYPDGSAANLRAELARFWQVNKEQVVLGNGSDELIHLLTFAWLQPGDEAVIAHPSFAMYKIAVEAAGGRAVQVGLSRELGLDLMAIAAAVTGQTKMIFLCNPNNPTGTIVRSTEMAAFLAELPRDIILVFDEAYREFVEDPDYADGLELLRTGVNGIVLRTFSKVYGLAGMRIGYALASAEMCSVLERVRSPFNVNLPAQAAAVAALADQEHIKRVLQNNRQQKQWLYQEFAALGLSWLPSESNFIFVNLSSTGLSGQTVFQRLLQRGVIIRTGFNMPDWIRVTIGTPAENREFIAALSQVLA